MHITLYEKLNTTQKLTVDFIKHKTQENTKKLLYKFIATEQWKAAQEFIDLLDENLKTSAENIITLIQASLKHYWQRNLTNYLIKSKITDKDIKNITYIAKMLNKQLPQEAALKTLVVAKRLNNIEIWSEFIATNNDIKESMAIFEDLKQSSNVSIDLYIAALQACKNTPNQALFVYEQIKARYSDNPKYNIACAIYLKILLQNNIDSARQFIRELEHTNQASPNHYWQMALHLGAKGFNINIYLSKIGPIEMTSNKHIDIGHESKEIPDDKNTGNICRINEIVTDLKNKSKDEITVKDIQSLLRQKEISFAELINNFGSDIIDILAKVNDTMAIYTLYIQTTHHAHNKKFLLRVLDYAIDEKVIPLIQHIWKSMPVICKSTDELNCYLLKLYFLENNILKITETFVKIKDHRYLLRQPKLLSQLLLFFTTNEFNALGNIIIKKLPPLLTHDIKGSALYFLTQTNTLAEIKKFPYAIASFQYLQKTIEEQRTSDEKLELSIPTSSIDMQLIKLTYLAKFHPQKACDFVLEHNIVARDLLIVIDKFNPLFIKLFKFLHNHFNINSEIEKHYILNLIKNGLWNEANTFFQSLKTPTADTESLLLRLDFIQHGYQSFQHKYQAMIGEHSNKNIQKLHKVYLEILMSSKKHHQAAEAYETIGRQETIYTELMLSGLEIYANLCNWDKVILILKDLYSPLAIQFIAMTDKIEIKYLKKLLLEIRHFTANSYLVEIVILLKERQFNQLSEFILANAKKLNANCYNYIIYHTALTGVDPLPWIKKTPFEFRKNSNFKLLALNWIGSLNSLNKAAKKIWEGLGQESDNIIITLKNIQNKMKFSLNWEYTSKINSFGLALIAYAKKTDLPKIFNLVSEKSSYFNRIFMWHAIKSRAINIIRELYDLSDIKHKRMFIETLIDAKKTIIATQELEEYKEKDKSELQLKVAMTQRNHNLTLTLLRNNDAKSIPNKLACQAIQQLWVAQKVKNSLMDKFSTANLTCPEKAKDIKEEKEDQYPINFNHSIYQETNFATDLDFKKIIMILENLLTNHKNNNFGFDFYQTTFALSYTKVKLAKSAQSLTADDDIKNFAVWCIEQLSIQGYLILNNNIENIKQNVSKDLYLILLQCTHKDPKYRLNLEELLLELQNHRSAPQI